jgi:hypothetical protein
MPAAAADKAGPVRVYLDTSVLNRPYDDQAQPRIMLETAALVGILKMIEEGELDMVRSAVLDYENSRNPFPLRREWVDSCLALAKGYQEATATVKARALQHETRGIKSLDALHVACAETAGCGYFFTCDDRIVKKYSGAMQVINPVDFIIHVQGMWR